jgi:nucleoside 2-deoxyribosyltransferase
MKGFISYRFTGEKIEDINTLLGPAVKILQEAGHEVYVNFYDPDIQPGTEMQKSFKAHDYIFHAFHRLNDRDFVLALLTSDEKSEGMLLEIGYALSRNTPVIVAVKEGVTKTYLPEVGTTTFKWSNLTDLATKLKGLDVANLKPRAF